MATLRGGDIYDGSNRRGATVRGNDVYDDRNARIGTVDDARRTIDGAMGAATVVAIWLFFIC